MSDSVSATNPRAAVMAAIRTASEKTGVDFGYLVKTAQRESNFRTDAKASTSSATGLFQFTSETWLSMLDRYGGKHGVEAGTREERLALRNDAELSAKMAGELAKENAGILGKKLGREATQQELYAAHFMGPSEAARLILAAREGATQPAAVMFPKAAMANANVFRGPDGAALTAAGLYQKLTGADIAVADGKPLPATAVTPVLAADESRTDNAAVLAARLGIAQLNSSLMAALFGFQEDKG